MIKRNSCIVVLFSCLLFETTSPDSVSKKQALTIADSRLQELSIPESQMNQLKTFISRTIGPVKSIDRKSLNKIINDASNKYFASIPAVPNPMPQKKPEATSKQSPSSSTADTKYAADQSSSQKTSKPAIQSKTPILSFLKPDHSDLNKVPATLQGKVYYLNVAQQKTNQCGYLALYNAKAIDEILKTPKLYEFKSKKISSKNINEGAKSFAKKMGGTPECQLEADRLMGLANGISLSKPLYVIMYDKTKQTIAKLGETKDAPGFKDFFASLHQEPFDYGYFVLNVHAHWTLAAIIKAPNENPYIIYIDTMNNPIAPNGDVYTMLVELATYIAR